MERQVPRGETLTSRSSMHAVWQQGKERRLWKIERGKEKGSGDVQRGKLLEPYAMVSL